MMIQRLLLVFAFLTLQNILSAQVVNSSELLANSQVSSSAPNQTIYAIKPVLRKQLTNSNQAYFTDTLISKSLSTNALKSNYPPHRWLKAAYVPAGLILAGTITLLPENYCLASKYTIRNKVLDISPGYTTTLDNNLQFAPGVAVFILKAAGVKSRSNFINQLVITAKAEILTNLIVHGMKTWIPSERPNGGAHSMPSGHTAQAFLSATILDMEYRDTSPWISVAGYAMATTTGVLRMVNNKHWISDVLIGAGIGIFSTKVVYFTHQYKWGKKNNMVILPAIYPKGGGISFAMQL